MSAMAANCEPSLVRYLEPIEASIGLPIDEVNPLRQGNMNTKFLLTAGGTEYVLKIYQDHRSFVSPMLGAKNRARAEYRGLLTCRSSGLAAPLPVGLFDDAVLMTKICGTNLLMEDLERGAISKLISCLVTFHSTRNLAREKIDTILNLHYLAAKKNIDRYISEHPDDSLAQNVASHLADIPQPSVKPVLLHGDPTLGNWLKSGNVIYALDFEFSAAGDPVFDVGLLLASVLDHGKFSAHAYDLCSKCVGQFEAAAQLSRSHLPIGLLCGLILIAMSVPQASRRHRILAHIDQTLEWSQYHDGHRTRP